MKGLIRRVLQQENIGNSWGYVTQVASQAVVFITVLNLFMLAATFYQTTLDVWLSERGITFPFWQFFTILIVALAILAVVLYKFAVPSFFSAFNDQFYKHNSQLRQDIELIKKKLGIDD